MQSHAGSVGLAPADADRARRAMLDGSVRTFFDGGLTVALAGRWL